MNSFSDTLIYALIVTLFGMGIVFIVLVLLQYILKSMEVIFGRDKGAGKAAKQPVKEEAPAPKAVEAAPEEAVETVDDEELVAVITAAVVSCLGGRSSIVVRNIRRVNDTAPVWAKTGRSEQMASRF